ncbi:MAG: DUF3237 domain-containing protein [Proteobacteria bacterium]|nr:DUF3237 domain-containing protein [Pseudomonadota bacterium]
MSIALTRRFLACRLLRLLAMPLLLTAAAACAQTPAATSPMPPAGAGPQPADIPVVLPRSELVYEAVVELDPTLALGQSPLGERRLVPITGGSFHGPRLKGKVLAGGADRQLVRADGARQLDALYEMQTDDGAILTVRNQVLVRTPKGGPDYRFSHVHITAPAGPHGWLNDYVYVGTLHSLRPRQAVLVRVYRLL